MQPRHKIYIIADAAADLLRCMYMRIDKSRQKISAIEVNDFRIRPNQRGVYFTCRQNLTYKLVVKVEGTPDK